MYNISDKTIFLGVDLGKYLKSFKANITKKQETQTKILWQNVENDSSAVNFIVKLKNDKECAGTIIEVGGWAKTIYVADILDSGTFEM